MKLELKHHSVITLVGPTRSGKTTFADRLADAIENVSGIESRVLSSDGIRQDLLEQALHGHDPRMLEVSEQAFKVLFNSLQNLISFPVNSRMIVIDTRGFDPTFRKEIIEVAKKNGYSNVCVMFDYKTASEYEEGLTEDEIKIVRGDVSKFRRKVLPDLKARDYDKMIRVKSRKQACEEELEVTLPDLVSSINSDRYRSDRRVPLAFIGDSHECVDELSEMVELLTEKYPGVQIVHMGDYLDKGHETERMLNFMANRMLKGDLVIHGNHEAYLYRRLNGSIPPADEMVEKTYFTALPILQENDGLKTLFFELFEASHPFLKFTTGNARTIFATHAPCRDEYLGKYSDVAVRAQRNLYVKDREAHVKVAMPFIYSQASMSKPLHVFGHIAHASENLVYKNKIFLDTGLVHGGKLTAMVFKDDRYDFHHVGSTGQAKAEGELTTDLTVVAKVEKKFNIFDYDLSPDDQKFLRRTIANGVKFISGTVSPAPSTSTELEPLDAAYKYFADRGVKQVVLQPKYMGSRCQVYLRKPHLVGGETVGLSHMAVSRNGFVIKHVEGLDDVLLAQEDQLKDWYDGNWNEIILDGELMPWSAMGRGLIDNQFTAYGALIGNELETLDSDTAFAKLDIAQNYDLPGRKADLTVFEETLALYSQDTELEFKPFALLSVDGRKNYATPSEMFELLNPDKCCVVVLESEGDLERGRKFFEHLTVVGGMEGVVVKPDDDDENPDVIPYMKVRNERYLTLVYGYDYKRRYNRLVQQKNIGSKARVSLVEYKLGQDMLFAKTDDQRREAVVKMIGELRKEKEMDPRL